MILCLQSNFQVQPTMDNPSPMDICCGRGKGKWNSPGNRRFKELVLKYLKDYESAPSKAEKSKVVEAVVKVVKDMGGRFVRHDDSAGQWYEIRPEERRAKVAHCIRDHLATTKKNSNRSSSSDAGQHSLSHRKQGRSDSHSDRERSRGSLARAQQEPARELSPILSSQSHYSARLQENENANARSSFPREGHADLALGLGHDHLPLASTTGSLLDRNFASRPSSTTSKYQSLQHKMPKPLMLHNCSLKLRPTTLLDHPSFCMDIVLEPRPIC